MSATCRALLLLTCLGCAGGDVKNSIHDVKARHEAELLALPGVVSVGIGQDEDGRRVILVGIATSATEAPAQLPSQLEGHPVRVRTVGPVRAH